MNRCTIVPSASEGTSTFPAPRKCWWLLSVDAGRAGLPMPHRPPPRDRDGTPDHWPVNDTAAPGAAA